jgi:hypothetical protein
VFVKGKHSDVPKAEASYTPALVRVCICKPAHTREGAFTDKTGGRNSKADVVKRIFAQAPVMVTQANREVTGGADSHYKTNQLTGMRKGSIMIRGFATKGCSAV